MKYSNKQLALLFNYSQKVLFTIFALLTLFQGVQIFILHTTNVNTLFFTAIIYVLGMITNRLQFKYEQELKGDKD